MTLLGPLTRKFSIDRAPPPPQETYSWMKILKRVLRFTAVAEVVFENEVPNVFHGILQWESFFRRYV